MTLDELTPQAIDYILEHIVVEELTDWEQGFVTSVSNQWERRRSLSEAQRLKLGEIWDRQP